MAHPFATTEQYKPEVRRQVRGIWHEAPVWVHFVIVGAGALLALAVVFISANWPYRHRKIAPMVEEVLASHVTFVGYHRIYFPNPGFVATGITMRRKSALNLAPLGRIDTLVVEGRWSDLILLRRCVQLVDITGLHMVVPAIGSKENHEEFPPGSGKDFVGPDTKIERIVVHKSLLEILRTSGKPLQFPIKQIEITNLHKGEALRYAVDMLNALPTGHILAHGSMGPMNGRDFASTPVSGDFAFTQVNLHDVGQISGMLDSHGAFKGTLQSMEVETSEETKDFAVNDGKPTSVSGTISCTLYASNGDLDIHSIELKVRETGIHARGTIRGNPKTTNLDIIVDRGRAEDLMRPFIHNEVPIAGSVWLRSHAYLGPRGAPFMQRLRVSGAFNVPAERVTDQKLQQNLTTFSERAQGKQKPNTGVEPNTVSSEKLESTSTDAISSLQGPAKIENDVASTLALSFRIPGARATVHGTFRFHDESVHLTGILKMDTDISHTTTGFKSFLLKPLAPFFKKKNAGSAVPIAVTGTPGKYQVMQNITHGK